MPVHNSIEKALKDHGDFYSSETATYVIKQAAKEAAQRTA